LSRLGQRGEQQGEDDRPADALALDNTAGLRLVETRAVLDVICRAAACDTEDMLKLVNYMKVRP
jgi:hypothetical protein